MQGLEEHNADGCVPLNLTKNCSFVPSSLLRTSRIFSTRSSSESSCFDLDLDLLLPSSSSSSDDSSSSLSAGVFFLGNKMAKIQAHVQTTTVKFHF